MKRNLKLLVGILAATQIVAVNPAHAFSPAPAEKCAERSAQDDTCIKEPDPTIGGDSLFTTSESQGDPVGASCYNHHDLECYFYMTEALDSVSFLIDPASENKTPLEGAGESDGAMTLTNRVRTGGAAHWAVDGAHALQSELADALTGSRPEFACRFSEYSKSDEEDDYFYALNPVTLTNAGKNGSFPVDYRAQFSPYYITYIRSEASTPRYAFLVCGTSEVDGQDGYQLIEMATVMSATADRADEDNLRSYTGDDTVDDGASRAALVIEGWGLKASLSTNIAGRNFYTSGYENCGDCEYIFKEETSSAAGWRACSSWYSYCWSNKDQRQTHLTLWEFSMVDENGDFRSNAWSMDEYWVGIYYKAACATADCP